MGGRGVDEGIILKNGCLCSLCRYINSTELLQDFQYPMIVSWKSLVFWNAVSKSDESEAQSEFLEAAMDLPHIRTKPLTRSRSCSAKARRWLSPTTTLPIAA